MEVERTHAVRYIFILYERLGTGYEMYYEQCKPHVWTELDRRGYVVRQYEPDGALLRVFSSQRLEL